MVDYKSYLKRYTNPGTIVGLIGGLGLLAGQFGIHLDENWMSKTIAILLFIFSTLASANNPDTKGIDIPTKLSDIPKVVEEIKTVEDELK